MALTNRMGWREQLGVEPEWLDIPPNTTPQKKLDAELKKVSKAKRKSGGIEKVSRSQAYCCRLVCLTVHEDFYEEYLAFRGGGRGTGRGEQDAREVGERHRFFRIVARAMAAEGWKDSNGNPLSVPDDHSKDEWASPKLKSLLSSLDLEGAAVSLRRELVTVFKGDEDAFYSDLQSRCHRWLKDVRGYQTVSVKVLK